MSNSEPPAPDNIEIIFNAADMIDRFREAGVEPPYPSSQTTAERVTEVIRYSAQRLFSLGGFATGKEVILRIRAEAEGPLTLASLTEPYFSGHYDVASEPSPYATTHGDLHFRFV